MEVQTHDGVQPARLSRLLGYLASDPSNLELMADAAAAADDAGDIVLADALLDRYESVAALPPALVSLRGLIALQAGRFQAAEVIFAGLRAQAPNDAALSFNLAWAKSMNEDCSGAMDLLTDAVTDQLADAAALKVQALHRLGRIDEALEAGELMIKQHPMNERLNGALALVALDAERPDLAKACAARAGNSRDGLSTTGMLMLNDDRVDEAHAYFNHALAIDPDDGRSLLGSGLVYLARGETKAAQDMIDRSAHAFGDHLGSWVASGWVHFMNGDGAGSRRSFQRALSIDPNFAESHGGLAVLDLIDGNIESARKRMDVALRLDRNCFAGALAKSLILSQEGAPGAGEKVRVAALNTPVGSKGRTIAQVMQNMTNSRKGRLSN